MLLLNKIGLVLGLFFPDDLFGINLLLGKICSSR